MKKPLLVQRFSRKPGMARHVSVSAVFPSGSGVSIVHRALQARLDGYHCRTYSPVLEYFPPFLMGLRRNCGHITHAPPDHAALVTPQDSHLVVTFHNYYLDPWFVSQSSLIQSIHYRTDLRWLISKAIERASRVTAVSESTAELVRDDLGFAAEVRVIPNGIDVTRFTVKPQMHEKVRILFSGNLSKRKGAHLLMPIAERLNRGIELWIASGLRGRNFAVRRSHNVRLLGPIPYEEMPALYNQVDILVMPSFREGFGLVAGEAMACGIPVVASNCSAMPELILDGQSGFLVEPGDVASFADRLNQLASDSVLRSRMGAFNHERILEHFSEDKMVKGYADLFSELV